MWKDTFTSKDAEAFGKILAQWELDQAEVQKKRDEYNKLVNCHTSILREYVFLAANLKSVPEQYRDNVWTMAWQEGHAEGWVEVYNKAIRLVDIFNVAE